VVTLRTINSPISLLCQNGLPFSLFLLVRSRLLTRCPPSYIRTTFFLPSAYSSTLIMEAARFSETSVDSVRTTWSYIPEDRTLHNHRCENFKSNNIHFNIIFTSKSKSPKRALEISRQNLVLLIYTLRSTCAHHYRCFDDLNNSLLGREYMLRRSSLCTFSIILLVNVSYVQISFSEHSSRNSVIH
jgi:hypothetical protein